MQGRASVLIGIVALAVVAGASMLARTPSTRSSALIPLDSDATAEGLDAPFASRRGEEAVGERVAGDVLIRSAATDARRVAESSRLEDAPERETAEAAAWVRLKLVDGITGEALPDASFAWASMLDVGGSARSPSELQAAVEAIGTVERPDPGGNVAFRPRPGNTVVAARFGALVAVSSVYDLRENELALFRPRTLELRAADAGGLPCADAPIRIRASSDIAWLGRTDAVGRVRIDYADRFFRRQHEQRRTGVIDALQAELMLGTVPPTKTSFTIEPWPDGPVLLTLPPSGSVVIVVTDAAGGPPPGGATVRLSLADVHELPYFQRLEAGRARIDSVQLGQEFRAEVVFDVRHASITKDFSGPTFAEPVVEVRLSCEKQNQVLAGRLLDSAGRPIRSQWFRVAAPPTRTDSPAGTVELRLHDFTDSLGRTDDQGAFSVVLVGDYPAGREYVVVLLHPHAGDPRGHARLELTVDGAGAPTYLGDVRLEPVEPP